MNDGHDAASPGAADLDAVATAAPRILRGIPEDQLPVLLREMPVGMVVHGPDGRILDANPAACRLLGITLEQLLGRFLDSPGWTITDGIGQPLTVEKRPGRIAAATGRVIKDTTIGVREGRHLRRWLKVSAQPLRDSGGEITGSVAMFTDVTELHSVSEELRAREEELQNLLEHSPIGVSLLSGDPDPIVLSGNAVFRGILGLDVTPRGQPLSTLLGIPGRDFVDQLHAGFALSLDGTSRLESPIDVLGVDEDRWVRASTATIRDEAGAVRLIMQLEDISEEHRLRGEMEYLAQHDSLTGLLNRRVIDDLVPAAVARAQRSGRQLALFFIDLDGFKTVNDDLGHERGDELLRIVAARLADTVRLGDTVARLGGDEFMVLAEDLGGTRAEATLAAEEISQRILEAVRQPIPGVLAPIQVTASIGVSFTGDIGDDLRLLSDADQSMYRAKQFGRNRVHIIDDAAQRWAGSQFQLVHDLRAGMGRGELRLALQPIVRIDGEPGETQHEVLVRWQHPEHGLLQPSDFLDLAERSGLIADLDLWVLEESARLLAERRAEGDPRASFHVNLSWTKVARREVAGQFSAILERYRLPASALWVELTEHAPVELVGSSTKQLAELRALGVPVGLDDFGTGASSLSYLQHLPITFLKVDRSFVKAALDDPVSRAIVAGVARMGMEAGVDVVAEGVETQEMLELVRELGCTKAQGWLIGRPVLA